MPEPRNTLPKVMVMPLGWKQKIRYVKDPFLPSNSYLELTTYNNQDMSTYSLVKIPVVKILMEGTEIDLTETMAIALGLNC